MVKMCWQNFASDILTPANQSYCTESSFSVIDLTQWLPAMLKTNNDFNSDAFKLHLNMQKQNSTLVRALVLFSIEQ